MPAGGFKAKRVKYVRSPHPTTVVCGECGGRCKPTRGVELYPPDNAFSARNYYVCPSCHARVTCHLDTWAPMGVPANAETRRLRNVAHKAVDPLWIEQWRRWADSKAQARYAVYRWCAGKLGLMVTNFHIGNLNAAQCRELIEHANQEYFAHLKTSA